MDLSMFDGGAHAPGIFDAYVKGQTAALDIAKQEAAQNQITMQMMEAQINQPDRLMQSFSNTAQGLNLVRPEGVPKVEPIDEGTAKKALENRFGTMEKAKEYFNKLDSKTAELEMDTIIAQARTPAAPLAPVQNQSIGFDLGIQPQAGRMPASVDSPAPELQAAPSNPTAPAPITADQMVLPPVDPFNPLSKAAYYQAAAPHLRTNMEKEMMEAGIRAQMEDRKLLNQLLIAGQRSKTEKEIETIKTNKKTASERDNFSPEEKGIADKGEAFKPRYKRQGYSLEEKTEIMKFIDDLEPGYERVQRYLRNFHSSVLPRDYLEQHGIRPKRAQFTPPPQKAQAPAANQPAEQPRIETHKTTGRRYYVIGHDKDKKILGEVK